MCRLERGKIVDQIIQLRYFFLCLLFVNVHLSNEMDKRIAISNLLTIIIVY